MDHLAQTLCFSEKEAGPEKVYDLSKFTWLLSSRAPCQAMFFLMTYTCLDFHLSLGVWINVSAQARQTTADLLKYNRLHLFLLFIC